MQTLAAEGSGRGISGSAAVAKAAPQGRPFPHPSGAESSEITQLATAAVQDEWCQLLIVREQVARRQRLLTSWEHRRALASDKERCMQCDVGLLGLQTALTALHQIGLLLLDPAETPDFVSETLVALAEILAAAAEDLPRDGSPSFPVLKFQLQELSEYLGEVTRPPHRR
mmetsp:Transcript_8871/g.18839  ORF Transcript_8871/g.18839 Transcript_8871/m.18839 type:complete len:170 (+) Transcript_8871:42-551(+)|eukprot:s484_g10.t1